jgi:hypothetical protein
MTPDLRLGLTSQLRSWDTNTMPWEIRHLDELDGILQTHAGSFGPGGFVWFPEGMEMEHGATQDNDVTFLFIANKPLDIHYTLVGRAGAAG